MSKIKCFVTSSTMDDQAGYKLWSTETHSLDQLFEFLINNESRSKIQKVVLQNEQNNQQTVTLVLESLVVRK